MAVAAVPAAPATRRRPAVPVHRGVDLQLPPHPDAPDPLDLAGVREWVRTAPRPTAIDLFCGAGGLSLGLRDAGFEVLVGADNDERALETHTANIGGLSYRDDLSDPEDFLEHLAAWGVRQVDLLAGGVPCQPFSRAGRSKIRSLVAAGQRSIDDPRAQMWRSFIRVAEALRPRAVLLENVPDLAVWDEGAILVGFCDSLRELGYAVDAAILNAHEHGVPQHRSRLFVVGLRPGLEFDWPEPSTTRPSIRQAIGDLPAVPPAQREERIAYGRARTRLQQRLRRGVARAERGWIHDHITRDVRKDDAEAYSLLGEGQTYKDLPARLQRYRADIFSDKYKRLEWDGLSRSITAHIAKDGYWYIHPDQPRTLSVREAARIQTFPDWFRFAGQPSLRYRQIGNAVPPLLAEAIGAELQRTLTRPPRRGRPRGTGTSFRTLLLRWHRDNARTFPWRGREDPWHVLMAEMCLHRTRADQVRPVYEALLQIAPTPAAMVAHSQEAREAMRSLGLRWRTEKIIEVARVLVEEHGGQVPSTDVGLLSLPGVGDYVANATLTFGFGRRAVLLDTNTERIVGRVRGRVKPIRWQLRLDLYQLAGSDGANAEFNYALLDLGALVCRAGTPDCTGCPVRRRCATGRGDVVRG
ncbi:MAG TPA: DNA (cytosine-5-)-methyltransferase [Solirubrobacteraceae bacterium]